MKTPLALLALAAALAAAGCGGDSDSSGPVSAAPEDSILFVEGLLRPGGELRADVDAIAERVAGEANLGEFIVSELEADAREEGEPFDFKREVDPWLGDRAGAFFRTYDGDDFGGGGLILESTDDEAAQRFIDRQAELGDDPAKDASFEGVEYTLDDDSAIGIVDGMLIVAEDRTSFEDAVGAVEDDSLEDDERYESAIAGATEGSLADLYVDVGAMLEQSDESIDPQARQILRGAGIDPSDATAVASLVPGENVVALDLSSDLAGEEPPRGDASGLLGRLPSDSFAAFAVSGFGKQLREAVDSLDESGIPGEVPPGELKSGLGAAGIDLDRIGANVQDAGVFAEGATEDQLGGALVLTTKNAQEARNTVSNIGLLLRSTGAPGVTAVKGAAVGFSVRDREELGDKPLVVVSEGDRIAIGYGIAPTLKGAAASAPPLSEDPDYRKAVAALGDTPISAFVDGPAALRLAESLVPRSDEDFREAVPYLRKIGSVALGSTNEGEIATAKLIVNLR